MWRLLMKNVYALGAYQVNKDDFDLQILYQDDDSGTPLPFIPEEGLSGELLIQTLNLDNLNQNTIKFRLIILELQLAILS